MNRKSAILCLRTIPNLFNMLPDLTPQRLAVKVKAKSERMIRKEHPWIFESAIVKQSAAGNAGDLAIIYDQKNNKLLALGLYDPFSPIRIKVIQFKQPTQIDATFFNSKIKAAYDIRRPLLKTATNSYRLIYGENDGFPSLIVDIYANVMVIKIYSLIWLPYLKTLLNPLLEISNTTTAVLRLSRSVATQSEYLHGLKDGQVLHGTLDNETVIFQEHSLKFGANAVKGHKTGYFLDHRHNRKRVGELAKNKSVLDVFAYAGGFSVHALAGGAKEVISLDISKQALEMAKQNVNLNFENANHKILAVDAFEGMQQFKKVKKQFDIVVVDPPSFAKQMSEREKALYSYSRLAQLAIPLVARNGILVMASCSSRISAEEFFNLVLKELKRSNRPFEEMERSQHDIDHPIGFPEGAYLKCLFCKLD